MNTEKISDLPVNGTINPAKDLIEISQFNPQTGGYTSVKSSIEGLVRAGTPIGTLIGANMNIITDQQINLVGGKQFIITDVLVCNAPVSLSNVAGAAFYATPNRASNQQASAPALHNLTTQTKYANAANQIVGITATDVCGSTLYFSLTVGQGSAATADIYIFGYSIS